MNSADYACRWKLQLRTGLWTIALLFVLNQPGSVASQELDMESPNRVKAAFMRNFAHYVIWPENTFQDSSTPWHIGILGGDPFGEVLETTFKGRMEQGRLFEIFRADKPDDLPACQIIFVAYEDATKRRAVLDALKDKPVLTVGDAPGFLEEGGIILFLVDDHVAMSVNLDHARSAMLTIQTKMLEVSREIVENGVRRSRK